jgi:hypothetical protein
VSRGAGVSFAWWAAIGTAELAFAILLLAYGYWWTIFVTIPATGICAYFARQAWDRRRPAS